MPISEKQAEAIEKSIIELTRAIKDLASKVKALESEIGLAGKAISHLSHVAKQ
jgi:hypothetical protein